MAKRANNDKLRLWQDRLSRNESAYESEASRMDEREALYAGVNQLRAIVRGERKTQTPHVRNICAELIEAQTDSNIPQPKVTARRKKDEMKAKLIEDMLRNELDRMPFEQLNDMMERTVPIQGGAAFLVEWDNTQRTHFTIGELAVSTLHPKQIVPQDGVYTGVEDMDYIILKIPQTKEYIRRKYGVSVADESEREPDVKGAGDTSTADDLVTQYIAYYRNDKGGIGLYSWVNDTELEDLDDYQARKLRRCVQCGAIEPLAAEPMDEPSTDGTPPQMIPQTQTPEASIQEAANELERETRPAVQRGGTRLAHTAAERSGQSPPRNTRKSTSRFSARTGASFRASFRKKRPARRRRMRWACRSSRSRKNRRASRSTSRTSSLSFCRRM